MLHGSSYLPNDYSDLLNLISPGKLYIYIYFCNQTLGHIKYYNA